MNEEERSRLRAFLKNVLSWTPVVIGFFALIIPPPYSQLFGFSAIIVFLISYFGTTKYRKWRLMKAQRSAERKKLNVVTHELVKTSDALIVQRRKEKKVVIKERTIGLRGSYSEYTFRVAEGEILHIKWKSDKPFELSVLDSWHSARSDFSNPLFFEPMAIASEEPIRCKKADIWTVFLASTRGNRDPRVTIEAWLD